MSLQSRLTLWAIALTALVVGIVSLIDLSSEITRQFDSTRNDAELIRQFKARTNQVRRHHRRCG